MKKYRIFALLILGLIAAMLLSGCVAANAGSPLFKEGTANASSAENADNGDEGDRHPVPSIQDGEENIDHPEKYNLSIMVIGSTVTTKTEVLEVRLENHGETDYYSGVNDFILMKKIEMEFSELQIVDSLTDLGVVISAGDSWVAHIELAEWFGAPLDPGEYRVQLARHSDVFCEFTVTEE